LFMIKGNRIQKDIILEGARIIDLAPSVLYLLDLPIPTSMDGKVLQKAFLNEAFEKEPIRFIEEEGPGPDFHPREIYSDQEEEELKKQLKNLGYLT